MPVVRLARIRAVVVLLSEDVSLVEADVVFVRVPRSHVEWQSEQVASENDLRLVLFFEHVPGVGVPEELANDVVVRHGLCLFQNDEGQLHSMISVAEHSKVAFQRVARLDRRVRKLVAQADGVGSQLRGFEPLVA